MDVGPPLLSVCVVMICLLGAACCSNGDKTNCPCPEIHQWPLTEPPGGTCFQINATFRYTCIGGYVRKVGTSNLIKCKQSAEWTKPTLQCIPDPSRTTTPLPKTTVTTAASTSLQMTQSMSTSASATTETGSTEPTSPGLQGLSNRSQAGKVNVTQTTPTDWTTSASTTAEPLNNGTVDSSVSNRNLGSATTAAISCASLAIVCALIGVSLVCYRRSKNNTPPHTAEEQFAMYPVPSAQEL